MASSDVWADFEHLRHNVRHNTVDRLKQILQGFNEECHAHLSKSGKKQEIIDRILGAMDNWRSGNQEDQWIRAKAILGQVRMTGIYTPSRMASSSSAYSTPALAHDPYALNVNKLAGYPAPTTVGRYDPFSPVLKPPVSAVALPQSASKASTIRFKSSPFLRVDHAVSSVVECPDSTSATDRKQQSVIFNLTEAQLAKLKAPGASYQLRLFCTSSTFHSPNANSFRTNLGPCPIEFPPTCEVRVNNVQLTANLKGLKKKPGTAPPPDIGKNIRMTTIQNRVEMVYVNSQQPVQPKKFYLVVMLVEFTPVNVLVDRLRKEKYRPSEDVRKQMAASQADDDDIIAGPQKMSLKCPLSYMRVNTPCRSASCVHSQCFDATSWYSMMEQTTTWICPVCEKVLNTDELIIDGYFDEILQQTPEDVDDVMVEADGEWHTTDNKYASTAWKALHPPSIKEPSKPVMKAQPKPTPITNGTAVNGQPKPEILVLDSDDEDEGLVKRELSPSYNSSSSIGGSQSVPQTQSQNRTQTQASDVIDLTGDSDDEAPQPHSSRAAGKRKEPDSGFSATSPTEQIWKKRGIDVDRELARAVLAPGSSSSVNGLGYPRHTPASSPGHAAPPVLPAPMRYVPYTGNDGNQSRPPPLYVPGGSPLGTTSSHQLPTNTHIPSLPRRPAWS